MPSFAQQVEAWAAKARRNVDAGVAEVVHDVADRIIQRSPVKSGLFRSNWMLGIDGPALATVKDTMRAEVNGLAAIPERAGGHRYFITNSLPYAARLEFGFVGPDSLGRVYDQPPQAILGVIPLEFNAIVRRAGAKVRS